MNTVLSAKQATLLLSISFLIRATVMFFVIQPYNFYKQADSTDYHNCAMSIATGYGMHRPDTHEPIFWRTPGYPVLLAFFYSMLGITSWEFDKNKTAQCLALWIQIILASLIPLILFYLAMTITSSYTIAIILSFLAAIHPGLVLASTYLLTEGVALIFFYLFLLFLFKNILTDTKSYRSLCLSALCLSVYTWMRPMGEFVAYITTILIITCAIGSWQIKIKKAALFFLLFFASIFPWYWRNYHLTGQWFFCPTIGTYLNCFSVPKILRRTLGRPLVECHKIAQQHAAYAVHKKRISLYGTGKYVSPAECQTVSLPIVLQYPSYFIYDWIMEAVKTTFDLYSYQMISMMDDSFWYDPIEEFLPDKLASCLYQHTMPWYLRLITWLELLGTLLMWIGLCAGLWTFVIRQLWYRIAPLMLRIWLLCIVLSGSIIGMTGGFGYARLRLPAEPLLIILSLTYWMWLYTKNNKEVE